MIFLHIGLNKCGSSSIQAFCDQHRSILRQHGLEYPKVGIHDAAHYGVSKALIGRPNEAQVPDAKGLEEVIDESVRAGRHVLLSSEYFFHADDAQVARIRELAAGMGAECRIIVYLRRHDQWITSLFNQALKTVPRYSAWQSDIRDYTLHLLGNRDVETRYSVILDRWARHFGIEALIVRPFEPAQFKHGDLVWDFLALIDADLPPNLQEAGLVPKRVNEALPESVLRAVDAVRSSGVDADVAKIAITQLLRWGKAHAGDKESHVRRSWDGRMYELPPHLRRALLNQFEDDYRYIASKYLAKEGGVLFRGNSS
jgi:hypothetical protein